MTGEFPQDAGADRDSAGEYTVQREEQMGTISHAAKAMFLGGLSAAAVTAGGGSMYLAHQIAKPKGKTLEQEKEWEIEQDLWGDFDTLQRSTYTIQGMDGYQLHCELVMTDEQSRKYVILTHGYTSNRYGTVKYIPTFRKLGYNCVIYDCRDHGENKEAACSIGNFEARDLLKVIEDTYARYGDDIELGLHGESMGSATSLQVLKYRPKVRFVVADCGFANLYELIRGGYRQMHIGFMIDPVNGVLRSKYHFDLKDTSPRDALAGNTVPICLIHGKDDKFIDPENSEKLSQATAGYCELHLVDGATHAKSRKVLGEEAYTKIVREFLENTESRKEAEETQTE